MAHQKTDREMMFPTYMFPTYIEHMENKKETIY